MLNASFCVEYIYNIKKYHFKNTIITNLDRVMIYQRGEITIIILAFFLNPREIIKKGPSTFLVISRGIMGMPSGCV